MRSIVPFSDMGSTFPTPRTESSRPSPDGEETHMLLKRKAAFDAVQPLFQAAEASVDRAAADAASCIAEMLRVREEAGLPMRSEERRVGKECVRTGRIRGWPYQ